jgi:hypothetical protein
MYFYFETRKNSGPASEEHCHQSIGYPTIFLVRVEKTSTAPFLKREAGGAQVYVSSLDLWVDMEPHMLQADPSAVGIPQPASNGYIFGWEPYYRYPSAPLPYDPTKYEYSPMAVLDYSLGDVTKGSDGRIVATTSMADGVKAAYTNESTDGVHFSPVNDPILNFESVTGLGPLQQGLSTPSLYPGGTDSCGRPWFYIGYSNVPYVDCPCDEETGETACYCMASVRIGTLFSTLGCPHPRPVIRPIFKGIMNLLNSAYVDGDGDGTVDADILASLNLLEEVGYERLNVIGGQEEGFPILMLAVGCHQKKNGKVECSSEDSDLPGLLVDTCPAACYFTSRSAHTFTRPLGAAGRLGYPWVRANPLA